ncbi:type VI secretion system-associated FHA domain protein TagH [Aquabacterium sp.]|uniref:type VI secretion system-associated FHA domain protein TagH n=1 Tax=Aquabacterium sp. TaxID=1872578 RepID=UPI002BE83E81|nr:type VI secretion system-associated FHA domain protein TagH [Aquabacterium sp.]HSW03530.1 type VI secretion system-associated FHA domain protein TagH [Aquabacterium sp.]
MSTLTLTVLRSPDNVPAQQRQAKGGELTIGRSAECDWPLADPLKSLSRKHCTLQFYSGNWQVRDLSVNGTFVNSLAAPVGRDLVQPLRDGDRLLLGDYEIELRIEEATLAVGSPSSLDLASNPFADAPQPFADAPQAFGHAPPPFGSATPFGSAPPFGGAPPFGNAPPFGDVAPPFGDAQQGFGNAPRPGFAAARLPGLDDPVDVLGGFAPASHAATVMPDHSASSSDAFVPPPIVPAGGKQLVPDDWFHTPVAAPAPPMAAFGQPAPAPVAARAPASFAASDVALQAAPVPAAPAAALRPVSAPAPLAVGGDMAASLAALLAGTDLTPDMAARAAADPEAALRNAGALLNAAIAGIRALLIARGSVKREFRIEQTMLRSKENNPLKFAASDEQALATLLDPRTKALHFVEESVSDLTVHQIATLAATQAAARALIEQMGPDSIEAEVTGGGLFPGALDKRRWEAYKRRHARLLEQFEDDFESAFGTAFARAYEQAVARDKS